jgi:hypothetical protein
LPSPIFGGFRHRLLGGFGVFSRVTVKSTPVAEGQWLIEIQEWKCWAYDDADFNARGQPNTQYLPIRIADFFGPEWIQQKVFETAEGAFGIERECLEHPMAYDKYMRQLAYNTYERTSVVTGKQVSYFPQPFRLIFSEWDFFQVTPTGAPHQFTITEPEATGGG